MSTQLTLFDYTQLDSETRIVAQQRAGEIKTLMRATAENVMQVGEKLLEVQAKLGNGQFDAWLQAEFDWSRRTAYNFIGVYKQFRGRANFAQMDVATSALYLLAAPSTPASAVDEVLDRAEAGERISHTTAKAIVADHKAAAQAAQPQQATLTGAEAEPEVAPEEPNDPASRAPEVAPPTALSRLRQQAKPITPPATPLMADRVKAEAEASRQQAQPLAKSIKAPTPPVTLDFSAPVEIEEPNVAAPVKPDLLLNIRLKRAETWAFELEINAEGGLLKGYIPLYYSGLYAELESVLRQAIINYLESETEEITNE